MAKKEYYFLQIQFSMDDNNDVASIIKNNVQKYLGQGWEIKSVTSISRSTLGNMVMDGGFTNGALVVFERTIAN